MSSDPGSVSLSLSAFAPPALFDVSVLAALVAASVTAGILAVRELAVLALFDRGGRTRREDDAAAVERDGLALLRSGEELFAQCQRFLRYGGARWYSDPLDPSLKNALNYHLTLFFARLRGLSAATFLEFAPRSDRLRRLGELAEGLYAAITDEAPASSLVSGELVSTPGALRRHDVHLLAERAWREVGADTTPLTYAEFLETFVDLGVGPRSELAPVVAFMTAAERGGPRRLQLVYFAAALAAFNAVLARHLGTESERRAVRAVAGLDDLPDEQLQILRRRYARYGVKLAPLSETDDERAPQESWGERAGA